MTYPGCARCGCEEHHLPCAATWVERQGWWLARTVCGCGDDERDAG